MRIGVVLRKYRAMSETGLRELASDISISTSTLSRVENGEDVDGKTMLKLLNWLLATEKAKTVGRGEVGREEGGGDAGN